MSLDGFSAFQEIGMNNEAGIEAEGLRYRNTILAMGGARAPGLVFKVRVIAFCTHTLQWRLLSGENDVACNMTHSIELSLCYTD